MTEREAKREKSGDSVSQCDMMCAKWWKIDTKTNKHKEATGDERPYKRFTRLVGQP